jgi:hypothetical protein
MRAVEVNGGRRISDVTFWRFEEINRFLNEMGKVTAK